MMGVMPHPFCRPKRPEGGVLGVNVLWGVFGAHDAATTHTLRYKMLAVFYNLTNLLYFVFLNGKWH